MLVGLGGVNLWRAAGLVESFHCPETSNRAQFPF